MLLTFDYPVTRQASRLDLCGYREVHEKDYLVGTSLGDLRVC